MKKLLLSFIAAMAMAAAANAQLPEGSVFPDFTLTSVTGQAVHLDSFLDAGYTVFINVFATWSYSSWSYRSARHLDSLYQLHGPAGWAHVDSSTTNDVLVLYVQGEPTSHLAELYLDSGSVHGSSAHQTPHDTCTQGNWAADSTCLIIDDTTSTDPVYGTAALVAAWHISQFPTVYMICRDHLVHLMQQPTAVEAYAAAFSACPGYAPSATVDVKLNPYTGPGYFICNITPTVSFQNYSANTLTEATITVKDATGAAVHTQPWTGSLAPFAVTSTPVTPFTGTTFGGYQYSVTAAGDTHTANDASPDSVFKVYEPSNAVGMPYSEDFEGAQPYKYSNDSKGLTFVSSQLKNPASPATYTNIIGVPGLPTTALVLDCYDAAHADSLSDYAATFVFGNYNIALPHTALAFDYSYAASAADTSTDTLEVQVSADCGATWAAAWTVTGSDLVTAPEVAANWYVPGAATEWKHAIVTLDSFENPDLMIQLAGINIPLTGQSIFIDNLSFVNISSVPQVSLMNLVSVFPNPAKDVAYVSVTISAPANVQVQLSDIAGHIITTVNMDESTGTYKIEVPTANLPTGLYIVKIMAGASVTTKQLSVIR